MTLVIFLVFFFFNQKTAYELRISDWSSDVCSSDLEDLTAKAEAAEAETKGDALTEFAVNLNVLAQEGRIDPLVGRGAEVERTIQVLCRRRKNNPLYVGEAGVGKTAL